MLKPAVGVLRALCDCFPELVERTPCELHAAQVDWHREWASSFDAWRQEEGEKAARPAGLRIARGCPAAESQPRGGLAASRPGPTSAARGAVPGWPGARSWRVTHPAPIDQEPLELVELARPEPDPGQVRVRVTTCGVCRTDLHVSEGDLPVHKPGVVPGHEVVGRVEALGTGAERFGLGERVGVAWLASTCGVCRFCRRGDENLCLRATFTGWDHRRRLRGRSWWSTKAYAYPAPRDVCSDDPGGSRSLCAGIIGYRGLWLTGLPGRPGGWASTASGASAHITATDRHGRRRCQPLRGSTRSSAGYGRWPPVGAAWGRGPPTRCPPNPLDARHLFRPRRRSCLDRTLGPRPGRRAGGGRYLPERCAGPHLRPPTCSEERVLRSVTANTRRDGEELLQLASRAGC